MIAVIDTSSRMLSCLLAEQDGTVHAVSQRLARGQAALADLLGLLAGIERSLDDVTTVAACTGPGSFTGIRVGLATAYGMQRAAAGSRRDLVVVGFTQLAARAWQLEPGTSAEVSCDAQRRERYRQQWMRPADGGPPVPLDAISTIPRPAGHPEDPPLDPAWLASAAIAAAAAGPAGEGAMLPVATYVRAPDATPSRPAAPAPRGTA